MKYVHPFIPLCQINFPIPLPCRQEQQRHSLAISQSQGHFSREHLEVRSIHFLSQTTVLFPRVNNSAMA